MAIAVKDEKRSGNAFPAFLLTLIIFLVGLSVYYLFFSKAPIIDVVLPSGLKNLQEISELNIDPSSVLEHGVYKSLREYAAAPGFGVFGRSNPFLPF